MRFFLLIAMFLIGNYSLFSQGTLEQFKKAVEEKEFVEALRYAPEVVLQNAKDNLILMMAADVYMEMDCPIQLYRYYQSQWIMMMILRY